MGNGGDGCLINSGGGRAGEECERGGKGRANSVFYSGDS